MIKTFKVLSVLLSYPTEELRSAIPEIRDAIREESLIPSRCLAAVERLIDELETRDIYDNQERYVFLFDRTRSLSLHLFEHVHGESRDRGQALVDLADKYGEAGLVVEAPELPDFLPLFLEFLSQLSLSDARETLGQTAHILNALGERLGKRQSPYAALFDALVGISEAGLDSAHVEALRLGPDDDPNDLDALDRLWEEDAVKFGAGTDPGAGCSKTSDILHRIAMARPQPGVGGNKDA